MSKLKTLREDYATAREKRDAILDDIALEYEIPTDIMTRFYSSERTTELHHEAYMKELHQPPLARLRNALFKKK